VIARVARRLASDRFGVGVALFAAVYFILELARAVHP
jgi:hypothetical protein